MGRFSNWFEGRGLEVDEGQIPSCPNRSEGDEGGSKLVGLAESKSLPYHQTS